MPERVKDCDGDMWTRSEDGADAWHSPGPGIRTRAELARDYGPLEPCDEEGNLLPPPATNDARALLAGVLEELAEDTRLAYWGATAGPDERVYSKLADIFARQAQELQEGGA